MMRDASAVFLGDFSDAECSEREFERRLDEAPHLRLTAGYWVRRLQASVHAEEYATALAAASRAQELLWSLPSIFEQAEFHFYAALAHAAVHDVSSVAERSRHLEILITHHRWLNEQGENCRESFGERTALVGAEIARIEGREHEAMHLYERAIRSARDNDTIASEALAYEIAARFYAARGFEQFAQLYLQNARRAYLRRDAQAKARQLDESYSPPFDEQLVPGPTPAVAASFEGMGAATVIRVSQAVCSEIFPEKLIETILRTAIEQSVAQRAVLILFLYSGPRIAAEAATCDETVTVQLCDHAATADRLPESVLRYVTRASENATLDDMPTHLAYAGEPNDGQRQCCSILCLPLVRPGRLIGALYLEKNAAAGVFTSAQTVVLNMLASQAAIALKNARLVRDLAGREAKIRRLVEASVVGFFIANSDGWILEANDEFLRIVGYDRKDLAANGINRIELTPSDWHAQDTKSIEEHKRSGRRMPIEKEYVRKDGSRVRVLIETAGDEIGGNEVVAFVLDLTDRKRAEAALQQSDDRVRALLQLSFDVYWETDSQHRLVHRQYTESLAEVSLRDCEIGKTPWEVPYLEPDDEAWRKHRAILDAHLPFRDFELARPALDGGKCYVSVSGLPRFDEMGQFTGYRGVERHITERKRAQEAVEQMQMELAHANRLTTMGHLTASIVHEVNQPIAALLTNAQGALRWMGAEPVDLDEVRQALKRIIRDGDRAGAIVHQVLNFSRKSAFRLELVEINPAIREVLELIRGEAMRHDVLVRTDLADALPLVRADRLGLQQVILNLIRNSMEAMNEISEGVRELLISAQKIDTGEVLFAVRDSGPGFEPAALDQIFQAFHTTKPNGLGLGLSICRSIVESHGGRLWASPNVPRGASFQFVVPAQPETPC